MIMTAILKDYAITEDTEDVREERVDDYTTSYSDEGEGVTSGTITVTNKMIPKNTSIAVKKVFADELNQYPSQIMVDLMVIRTDREGNSRITMIKDCNCMNLKGYIAGCRIFIGARTHSVIAAYSSCVPTLAVGYSIKAKGIAKDIFGSYDKYVVPVENMTGMESLLNAYRKITDSSEGIEKYLQKEMPTYRQKAVLALEAMKRVGLL